MISGAYSNKYKVAQNEHLQQLKEQAKIDGQNIKDKVKQFSKETNRRRKALDDKKKQLEEEEERQREAVLSERRKEKEDATQKFQKDYSRKKTRPGSGKPSKQTESPQLLQDGIRIVRGHVVEIKNGEQIAVPTLEDALNMVNKPYTTSSDHNVKYYGPAELYNDISNTDPSTPSIVNVNGSDYDFQGDPFQEQVKLRENALQNGGTKFAFMSDECTDGALPQTMGRNSPSGSLTSLDSLDEVPSDCLPGQNKCLAPITPITGIIAKDKAKSTERRRVTFSDSIEFDDGLTGQLVTVEKESCKQLVKQYNNRLMASNAAYSASLNATKLINNTKSDNSSAPVKILGNPGNTPLKKGELPSTATSTLNSSTSMVIPKSLCEQFAGNKPIASTGEATSSSNTHTDHPIQCVAEVDSDHNTTLNGLNNQNQDSVTDEELIPLSLQDSLDNLQDSLEMDAPGIQKVQHDVQETQSNTLKINETEPISTNNDHNHGDGFHGNEENELVDYYGNPTTMYHHPFGARNTLQNSDMMLMEQEIKPNLHFGYAPDLLLSPSGQTTGQGDVAHSKSDTEVKNNQVSTNRETAGSPSGINNRKGSPNSSYYKSWYPGSFFNSKTYFGEELDNTVQQDKVVKKNTSVAYNLVDNEQIVPNYTSSKQKGNANTSTNRPGSNSNTVSINKSGRINPLHNTQSDNQESDQEVYRNQIKSRKQSSVNKDSRSPKMTAKPPHPSTRHKGVVYSSPLHRKRAAAAAARRTTTGKQSPRTAARKSPTAKAKEIPPKGKNVNDKKIKRVGSANSRISNQVVNTRGNSSSSSDEDEMLQSIRRDMDKISMLSNPSPVQEEHQKILNAISFNDSPTELTPDQEEPQTKTDFRSVYKKVHRPRIGSANQRAQLTPSNRGQPSKIPVYLGQSGNKHTNTDTRYYEDNGPVPSNTNQRLAAGQGWTDIQNSRQRSEMETNELVHPQTAALKQSIPLDKTPTDDEINILWDRVRNCLNNKDSQSVGSDSCVNRIDVRKSHAHTGPFVTHEYQDMYDSSLSRIGRASSITGMGNVGGLRHYGSQEVLRRYGSADNISHYRQQPLLQHRAQKTRQSQGKPPFQPRQQLNFSPMASRQAPAVSMSSRAGPVPLTQKELRAVMKASQQTQEQLQRAHNEQIPDYGYQTNPRTGPSALSIEENKLLESIDRLNERLRVQGVITGNTSKQTETCKTSPKNSRPANHQRASSATYKYNTR